MNLSIDTEVIFDERRGKDYISANPPFYDSSTFHQDQLGGSPLYDYARSGNPNRTILEEKLAHLEKGKYGFAFASGWWLKNNPPEGWIERLNKVDFIYISHTHPDHLNEFTLSKIRKDMEFIIPEFKSKSVEKILLKLGFNNLTNFRFDSYYQF